MPFLSISHLSLWMSIAAIVALFALLLLVRARRQRQGDTTQPETGRAIAHQLGRIADALERSSLSRETQPSEVPHDEELDGLKDQNISAGIATFGSVDKSSTRRR